MGGMDDAGVIHHELVGQIELHRRRLRALARQLVRDDDSADDALQDSAVVALTRSPSGLRDAAAWLAGVVRRVALRSIRTATRRERREQAVARRETDDSDSTVAALERAEALRSVANAVAELPEPYRTTIVLRFLEELPIAAIAARESIPESTVRTRLRRALLQLRAALDAKFADGRAGWVALLAPWVDAASATVTGPIGWKLAAALLLASAPLLWVLRPDASPAPHAELRDAAVRGQPLDGATPQLPFAPATSRTETSAVSLAAPVVLGSEEIERLRLAPLEALPLSIVRGRVVRPDGSAATDATVTLVDPTLDEALSEESRTVRCDGSGTFRVDAIDFRREWRLELEATDAALSRRLELLPGCNDLGTLLLEPAVDASRLAIAAPACAVRGSIVDADGHPIAGATIRWRSSGGDHGLLRVGADGRFDVQVERGELEIEASAFRFEPARLDFAEPPLERLPVVLRAAAVVPIEVVDRATDRAPEGVDLRAKRDDSTSIRRGPDEGQFAVTAVKGALPPVIVTAPSFARRVVERLVPPPSESSSASEPASQALRIVLPREEMVAVRIRDEEGRAIAGATVVARRGGDGGAGARRPESGPLGVLPADALAFACSDGDGIARLFGVARDATELLAWADGYGATVAALAPSRGAGRATEALLEIVFRRPGSIEGVARRADGSALAAASIRLTSPAGRLLHARSDAEGRFRFESLAPAGYELRFASPADPQLFESEGGWFLVDANANRSRIKERPASPAGGPFAPPLRVAVRAGETTTVELLDPALGRATLAGRVRFGGAPLPGAVVRLLRERGESSMTMSLAAGATVTDADGRFAFVELPAPSDWQLRVAAGEGLDWMPPGTELLVRSGVRLEAREESEIELDLPATRYRGVVRDARTLQPLAGVELRIDGRRAPGSTARFTASRTITTDRDGSFDTASVPAGRWHATLAPPGYLPFARELVAAGGWEEPFDLEPGGWVRLVPVTGSPFDVKVIRVVLRVGPEDPDQGVSPIAFDRARAGDGAFWLFVGDPTAERGNLGWVAPRFTPLARVTPFAADGVAGAATQVELPLVVGSTPQLSLGE